MSCLLLCFFFFKCRFKVCSKLIFNQILYLMRSSSPHIYGETIFPENQTRERAEFDQLAINSMSRVCAKRQFNNYLIKQMIVQTNCSSLPPTFTMGFTIIAYNDKSYTKMGNGLDSPGIFVVQLDKTLLFKTI